MDEKKPDSIHMNSLTAGVIAVPNAEVEMRERQGWTKCKPASPVVEPPPVAKKKKEKDKE